ncbi:hypothetical protein ACIBJE_19470 [Micromonospora sp. NPDC050187]|uniref:hypothetical protein n=1 Tax=Micromonospora sp. NPDC050187 TaxID=3364277 RepID=UPI0037A6DD9B
MGDGDAADAGDLGGPDFSPAAPAAHSSAVGAPPTSPVIVLGPGYRGRIVLPRAPEPGRPLPPAAADDLDDRTRTGPAGQHDQR